MKAQMNLVLFDQAI